MNAAARALRAQGVRQRTVRRFQRRQALAAVNAVALDSVNVEDKNSRARAGGNADIRGRPLGKIFRDLVGVIGRAPLRAATVSCSLVRFLRVEDGGKNIPAATGVGEGGLEVGVGCAIDPVIASRDFGICPVQRATAGGVFDF